MHLTYIQKKSFFDDYLTGQYLVKELSKKYNISLPTGYNIINKFKKDRQYDNKKIVRELQKININPNDEESYEDNDKENEKLNIFTELLKKMYPNSDIDILMEQFDKFKKDY